MEVLSLSATRAKTVEAQGQDFYELAKLEAARVQKKYGASTVVELGESEAPTMYSTGLMYLDWATVAGGIPSGGITLLYGERGCGKSALAHRIMAEIQQREGCGSVWISSEGKFDEQRAALAGVDLNKTIRLSTSELETAYELMRDYIRQGGWNPIVLDSISNLSPRAMLAAEKLDEKEYIGFYARRTAAALRQFATDALRHGTSVIIISHVVSSMDPYKAQYGFHGGKAMEHNALLIAELRVQGYISPNFSEGAKIHEEHIGKKVAMLIRKNKRGPEGRTAMAYYLWDNAFDIVCDRVLMAEKLGVLHRSGSWYTVVTKGGEMVEHDGKPLRWQGLASVITDLQESPEKLALLEEAVLEALRTE